MLWCNRNFVALHIATMSTEPESLDLNVSVEDELNTLMNEYLVKKEGEVIH